MAERQIGHRKSSLVVFARFPSSNDVRVLLLNQPNDHLSATATVFVGQSIHWLLFKHLYNGHFLLSQGARWGEVQLFNGSIHRHMSRNCTNIAFFKMSNSSVHILRNVNRSVNLQWSKKCGICSCLTLFIMTSFTGPITNTDFMCAHGGK